MADVELRTATELDGTSGFEITDTELMPITKATAGSGLFRVKLATLKAYFLAGVLPAITGQAGKFLAVKGDETGTEWAVPAGGGGGGGGALPAFAGAGKVLTTNATNDLAIWKTPTGGGGGGGGGGGILDKIFGARIKGYSTAYTGGSIVDAVVESGDFRGLILHAYTNHGPGAWINGTPIVVPAGKVAVAVYGECHANRFSDGDYYKDELYNATTATTVAEFGGVGELRYARSGSFHEDGANSVITIPPQVGVAGDTLYARVASSGDSNTRTQFAEFVVAFVDPTDAASFDDGTGSGGAAASGLTPPLAADFPTLVGYGGTVPVMTDEAAGMVLETAAIVGADKSDGAYKATPGAADWSVITRFYMTGPFEDYRYGGVSVRNSTTDKTYTMAYSLFSVVIGTFFCVGQTANNGQAVNQTSINPVPRPFWLRVRYVNSTATLYFELSFDKVHWGTMKSYDVNSFLGGAPDQVGFKSHNSGTTTAPQWLVAEHWEQTF